MKTRAKISKQEGKITFCNLKKKTWLETINAQNVHGKNNVRGRRGKSKRGSKDVGH
jgi:hypothetical protein